MINGSLPTTVAQVEFIASKTGLRQICLNASDELVVFQESIFPLLLFLALSHIKHSFKFFERYFIYLVQLGMDSAMPFCDS